MALQSETFAKSGSFGLPAWLGAGLAAMPRPRAIIAPILVFILVIGLWQFITEAGYISPLILPSPTAILNAFAIDGGTILYNTAFTTIEALTGFVLGNLLGFLLAVVFLYSEWSRRTVYPLAMAAQAVPIVAVAPALIIWFGNGMAPKIFVTIFLVFFPMLVNALRGLKSADAEVMELLYTLSATRRQQLWMVRLPASIPFLFNALKLSACACFVAAIVAEWIAADRGLGHLIVLYGSQYRMPQVWAVVLVGTIVSMLVYGLVVLAEARVAPWLVSRKRPASE
ncbi:ABC transporter permease [Kaistia dalseonensis]|uniref:ABC-type nitrate/sulfonate/bicarbonate transport system permease component n=1 Tax=Kaistia dalseonensis TaxID=410840 RepID=A0ABU0HDN3_9HYPH|nr:ABC transporter permease [Kaistia dalseonensis]MCX5497787.1 ABC transporter permease [Kaistia dalseonensis]MDQ0440431.1 ABC-type nitrate/sulfonate/bicarbonate transport system permease component [Kaistia dalseonensis]